MLSDESESDTVVGRMKHLLDTGEGVDCHFLVGKEGTQKEVVSAHKAILCSASDVFRAMFRFDAGNTKRADQNASSNEVNATVEVIDVEPTAFKAMLSYIYIGDLSELNRDIFPVLYAANKYNIRGLIKACMAFPIAELRNVFLTFARARILGEEDFARRCLEYIDQNATSLILTEQFLQIDHSLLCEIFERDQLNVEEITIWDAALRWAKAQCCQDGMPCSAANFRFVLGLALPKIRFPLISKAEFTTKIVPSGVLSSDEVVSVLLYHDHPDRALPKQYPLRFSTEERASAARAPLTTHQYHEKLLLTIENTAAFARGGANEQRCLSYPSVQLAGLKWNILAKSGTKYLSFHLQYDSSTDTYAKWSVNCSATLRIVSRNNDAKDFTRKFCNHPFSSMSTTCGFDKFITFEHLLDPRNGLCSEDKTTLSIDFSADAPRRWSLQS